MFGFLASCDEYPSKNYGIKEVVKTKYFEIKINLFGLNTAINTGNIFSRLPEKPVVVYAWINISFKNIDAEYSMIIDGQLILVCEDNKQYTVLARWFWFIFKPSRSPENDLIYL